MSLSIRIEDIAKTIVNIDTTDLPALVRLQDELADIGASIEEQDQEGIISACNHAAEAVESIVLRSADDPDKVYHQVCESIDYIQSALDAAAAGGSVNDIPKPNFMASEDDKDDDQGFDEELLAAWIDSCGSALNDLESTVVELESGINDAGQDAEARRVIHTIKGEAGILSYNVIQKVCHECESLIDVCASHEKNFPATEVLEVIDWVRSCIAALMNDAKADFPDSTQLLETLMSQNQMADGAAGEDATEGDIATEQCPESEVSESGSADIAAENAAIPDSAEENNTVAIENDDDGFIIFPPEAIIDDTTADFVCEAQEHIANAESSLMELENDFTDTELINTVFRAFHTIKGVAGFMNLTPIVRLTHIAETLLDKARSGKLDLSSKYLDLFLKSCDVLGQLINSLQGENGPRTKDYNGIVSRLDDACNGKSFANKTQSGSRDNSESAQRQSTKSDAAQGVQNGSAGQNTVCADTQNRQKTENTQNTKIVKSKSEKNAHLTESKKVVHKKAANKYDQTVKVNTQRMDALIDMVGELVIGYQMVAQDDAIESIEIQKTKRTIGHVSNIIRDLQEVAMSLRLVTLRSTFQKMARLVRDLSSKSGKNIRLIVEGEDVELDRGVVEHIADPLVHMIRNACDHGIETVDERHAANKSAEGKLWLRAYHQGGSIVIEIKEDGRGLSREKLLEKAIKLNLVSQDRNPNEYTDQEVFNFIFMPGFSTAEKVTDVSGRGVGMDVVRRNIESLRGKIEIQSELGKGSTFKIQLPLTMAIIDGMVVRVGNQRYVIPTLTIEQSFRPSDSDIHTVAGRGEMVEVRGTMLPIYRAKTLFRLQTGEDNIENGLMVVVESRDMKYCLFVDEIVGQQQVVIKSLGHGVASVPGVSGGAILGDGRVALILDVGGLNKLQPMSIAETV